MRASLVCAAVVAGFAAWSGSAFAQGVGVYVGPAYDDYYAYDDGYGYGPRSRAVYGYYGYRDRDGVEVEMRRAPYPRGGCGVYHFWNGERCVDARGE